MTIVPFWIFVNWELQDLTWKSVEMVIMETNYIEYDNNWWAVVVIDSWVITEPWYSYLTIDQIKADTLERKEYKVIYKINWWEQPLWTEIYFIKVI